MNRFIGFPYQVSLVLSSLLFCRMIHRSSFAAFISGSLILTCSWPILAQHSSIEPTPPTEPTTQTLPNPIENLPEAPKPGNNAAQLETAPTPIPGSPEEAAVAAAAAMKAENASTVATSRPSVAIPITEYASFKASEPVMESEPTEPPIGTETLRSVIDRLKLPLPVPNAHIVVLKSQRRLDLYSGKTLLKSYQVALGKNPNGHKQREGDGRTPEGQFYICTRNGRTSAFHMFLGLSYPALPDAKRAVKNKTITPREFNAIRGRLASRAAPLWETRLGGWVGIHGGSDSSFARKRTQERGGPDWTGGCIAVTDREIEEIYAATKMGTPVLVKP